MFFFNLLKVLLKSINGCINGDFTQKWKEIILRDKNITKSKIILLNEFFYSISYQLCLTWSTSNKEWVRISLESYEKTYKALLSAFIRLVEPISPDKASS